MIRVPIDLPGERLYPSTQSTLAISPQGDVVVFLAQSGGLPRLMIRRTGEVSPRDLTAGVVNQPAFSADGRWVSYAEGSRIYKVPVEGGASIQLASIANSSMRGFAWIGNDSIIVATDRGMMVLPAKGGVPHPVAGVDTNVAAWSPVVLSDGETIAYTTGSGISLRRVTLTSLTTQRSTTMELLAAMVLGMRDGHLLYITAVGELYAAPFDLKRQQLTGDPVQLETGVRLTANGSPLAALSASGSLWFASGQVMSHLVRAMPGRVDQQVLDAPRAYRAPRVSPNGRMIAVTVAGSAGSDVWLWDITSRTFQPLTTDGASDFPEWSPDSKHVIFRSLRNVRVEIHRKAADGSGTAEHLYTPKDVINEVIMSPDAQWLILRTAPGPQNRDIFAVQLSDSARKPVALVAGPNYEAHPRLSPDGKWLAYQSDESDRFEIYVRPFPNSGARVQVSNQGGTEPLWSRTGNAIVYRVNGRLESAQVTSSASTFTVRDRRTVLPQDAYAIDLTHQNWDIWPDGNSYLMVKPAIGDADRPILVHNWGRAVREKLRGGAR